MVLNVAHLFTVFCRHYLQPRTRSGTRYMWNMKVDRGLLPLTKLIWENAIIIFVKIKLLFSKGLTTVKENYQYL